MASEEGIKGMEVEDKFKFALLQVDKRLVNLEVAIGEINEKIKSLTTVDVETINQIKERLDELEDLIMVENLGGLELKRFLENIDSRTTELSQKTASLSESVKNFEEKISELKGGYDTSALKDNINKLEKNIEKIENELKDINKRMSELTPAQEVSRLENNLGSITSKIDEIVGKIESLEPSILKKVEEKIFDLKDIVTGLEGRIKSVEEMRKSLISLEEKISELKERIRVTESSMLKKVDEKISVLPLISEQILSFGEEISKLKEEASNLHRKSEQLITLENEIKRLEERIRPLETQIIQRVVSEISELRSETSKEIKEIKDKISGMIATKSEIDIKFLSSRFNALKENVDYLLNRKAEFDMKIDNLQKALAKIAEKVEEMASKPPIPASFEERLASMEKKIEAMPDEIFGNIKNVISQLPGSVREGSLAKSDVDTDIKKLLEKIAILEDKIISLKEYVKGSESGRPLIVE
ncbi:MAG: hypothetical protein QXS37_02835 [Candidatus Aenigmatarchaeota archaeon]